MAAITLRGKPTSTSGQLPPVGADAPDFMLVNTKLASVTLANFEGKKKLLNIVPSLDTPTCANSARKFNEKAAQISNTVVLVVSADLPFAQGRFCQTEGLKNVIPLSTMRSNNFAEDYGVRIEDGLLAGLNCRAVVVIDEANKIVYTQMVNELTNEPDYDKALAIIE